MDRSKKIYSLLKVISILFGIQATRIMLKQIIFQFVDKSILSSDIIMLSEMLIFTVSILLICNKFKIDLSVFPNTQHKVIPKGYAIATIIIVLFIIVNLFIGGFSSDNTIVLISSTIAIPIFEELLFRGYIWNELKQYYKSDFTIYVINTLLFAIWHLGYFDSIWFRMTIMGINTGFPFAMFMKAITGLCFGIIIGLVRYKLKNCYAAILVHSCMNIFGK